MNRQDKEYLEKRLGSEYLSKRLKTEKMREEEFHAFISSKFTFFKLRFIRPLQRLFLWLIGCYGKGRDELASPTVTCNIFSLGGRLPEDLNDFRILHLSDLHIDIDEGLVDVWTRKLRELDYDLCVMTGDYRNKTVGCHKKTIEFMARLRPAIKTDVYLAIGNHDFIEMVPELERAGYRTLVNESVEIEHRGAAFTLAGIDDPVIFKTDDIEKAISGTKPESLKILLSHSPNTYAQAEKAGIDILLAGHTHGGQICLPSGKAIISHDRSPKHLHRGLWRHRNLQGYTSRGCGASGLPIRLNCPPEFVIHTLRIES